MRGVWVVAIVAASVTALVLGSYALGVLRPSSAMASGSSSGEPHTEAFGLTISKPGEANEQPFEWCPAGGKAAGTVSFTWKASGSVHLEVLDPSQGLAYSDEAKSGSGSFATECGTYEFLTYPVDGDDSASTTVSGEYAP